MQIKVLNKIFDCIDSSVQLSFGSHATIDLNFDINQCQCYDHFIKIFESNTKFEIESKTFLGKGCHIKTFDIDYNQNRMNISIHCDLLNPIDLQMRREDFLNDILTKTFIKKDDIN
jgi:hypothetical protein